LTNLCVCTHLPLEDCSGAADRIINLVDHVSKNGVNVYLVNRSLKKSLFSLALDDDKYYKIESGIKSECLYPLRIRLLFPGFVKLMQEILNRIVSILTISIPSEVCLSYLLDPYLIVKLFFVCKKEKIDIIQCEFPIIAPSSFIVKSLLKIPLVYDSHNVETERMKSMANVSGTYVAMTKLIEKASCILSDSIFVVSEKDKEDYTSWGISERKIAIIPNSVETQRFSPFAGDSKIRNYYKLSNKMVIIFHGNLLYTPNEEACQILAQRILPEILKHHPETYLLLVGRNPPRLSHPNIVLTGFVEKLPEYIAAADIAVVPLLRGGGTRIKIIQYMACGIPVVSTINTEFTNIILKLVEDDSIRKKIGINARKKVELLYDWEKTAENAVQVYKDLLRI
jgi:glycosyltransferase involved in cell wall biosynthesis